MCDLPVTASGTKARISAQFHSSLTGDLCANVGHMVVEREELGQDMQRNGSRQWIEGIQPYD